MVNSAEIRYSLFAMTQSVSPTTATRALYTEVFSTFAGSYECYLSVETLISRNQHIPKSQLPYIYCSKLAGSVTVIGLASWNFHCVSILLLTRTSIYVKVYSLTFALYGAK